MTAIDTTLGERFAHALAAKDRPALLDLLAPDVDFRGLTSRRSWEATTREDVIDKVLLAHWFEPTDHIEKLASVSTDQVADRPHVSYRLHVQNPDGHFLVEQQVYYTAEADKITWMRALCSGYRPVPGC